MESELHTADGGATFNVHDLRDSALKPGPRWLPRHVGYAFALGAAGYGQIEIETEFDGHPAWGGPDRPTTAAAIRASQAIESAFADGARAGAVAAVKCYFDRREYEPGQIIYHAAGLAITGAKAGDVNAETLQDVIEQEAARRGVIFDRCANLEFECHEACGLDWCRPTFRPDEPPAANPAAPLASDIFKGWLA